MAPAPKLKVNDLLERLSALLKQSHCDQMALKRIEREAELLVQSDALGGYIALGVVSSIKGNAQDIRAYYEKSLKLSDNYLVRENYGNSLAHLHLWSEALLQFDKALSHSLDVALLKHCIGYALQSGHPEKASQYIGVLVKAEPAAKDDSEIQKLLQIIAILRKSGLSDDDMAEITAMAESVALEFGATIVNSHIWLDLASEYAPSVVNHIKVHLKDADVIEMNWRLAECKAYADTEALRSGKYSISFIEAAR